MEIEKWEEIAAKKLCKLRGKEPDYVVEYNGHNQSTYNIPNWEIALAEIREVVQIQDAITFGRWCDRNAEWGGIINGSIL